MLAAVRAVLSMQGKLEVFRRLHWPLHRAGRRNHAQILSHQRTLRVLVMRFQIGVIAESSRLFLSRAACLRLLPNFKFELLTLRDVTRVVAETVKEFSLRHWFGALFLNLLTKLLELESLEVNLLEALHAWVVLHRTLERAL